MLDFSKNLLFLAPLAGFTDLPFRKLVKEFGADITFSEMISSNALSVYSPKTLKMIEKNENEDIFFVQIAANSPEVAKKAVEVLNEFDYIAGIDLNAGCPAKKVVAHGSGAALLKDLKLLVEILNTIKEVSNKKYLSVKVRIGFDKKISKEIAVALKDTLVDFVSVHARTRECGYKDECIDYSGIEIIKRYSNKKVVANGNIRSYFDAIKVKKLTGADAIMIGRGAIGAPWIFYSIKNNQEIISMDLKRKIILRHLDLMVDF